MKKFLLAIILLAITLCAPASVLADHSVEYVPATARVLSQYAGAPEGGRRFRVNAADCYVLALPDGTNFSDLTPSQVSNLVAAASAAHQAAKSDLHKAADNALIDVLIRGGLVPADTTALTTGTESAVTLQLLQMEVADPTNAVIQSLSSKLDRLKGIIEREGGSPDDAVLH